MSQQLAPGRGILAVIAFALTCAFGGAGQADAQTPVSRPNVIVVLADDLGFGDLGSYGSQTIRTPNLDRMASEGARLTSFFASANVCTPSRAGLLTGRYPARSGLAVAVLQAHSAHGLPDSEVTLGELLADAGYRTALLGKWHLGSTAVGWPTNHGFERFWGVPWSNDMTPLPLYRNTTILEEPLVQETFAGRLVDEARAIIAEPSDRPFFLFIAPIAPHLPLRPGPAFRGRSQAGLYGDFVEELDWTIGEILTAVRAAGKDRQTLVVFTSDNGPWFEGSSGPLRDRKGSSYEGAYAVPMLARWPGRIPRGLSSDQIAINLDLFPTVAGVAGVPVPQDRVIDGRDIWPLLTRRQAQTPHQHLLFFTHDQIAAVRTQGWRYVVRTSYQTFDVPLDVLNYRLLFDMRTDRSEQISVFDRHPDIAAQLNAVLMAARAEFAPIPQVRPTPAAGLPIQLPGGPRPGPETPARPILGDQPPMSPTAPAQGR